MASILVIAMFPTDKTYAASVSTPGIYYVDILQEPGITSLGTFNGTGKIKNVVFYDSNNKNVGESTADFELGVPYNVNFPVTTRYIKFTLVSGYVTNFSYSGKTFSNFTTTPPNVTPDTTPPAVPTGLVVVAGEKTLTLSWDRNKDTDFKGYNVYLDGVKVTTSVITATNYSFTNLVGGKTYTLSVSAVDQAGNESARVSITGVPNSPPDPPAPPDTTPPTVPVLQGKPGRGQAVLTWTNSPEPDLRSYNLYQDGEKVGNYTSNSATVSGLKNGQEYGFQVTAIDTTGNESKKSNKVLVTPAEKLDVNVIPNGDSIIVQIIAGGVGPYVIDWGEAKKTVDQSQYTIGNLKFNTEYTVTVTDANGLTYSRTLNTGDTKGYVPPTFPSPQEMFQRMLDVFGTAGTIALAVIGGAVALGILCVLALWGWRLLKRWLSRAK